MARPGGLGKGLGALIPADAGERQSGALRELPTASIRANPRQPRRQFDEEGLAELAESIRELGLLQPVLVRPVENDEFELIAGERRWRAARRVGIQTIPALVRSSDDASVLQQAIVENVQREELNALDEAAAYQQLIEDFELTHDQVAQRVGKSRATITNALRLLQLPPSVQKLVRDGGLRPGHARALLGTPDRALQERIARRVVDEDLSVRAVENAVKEQHAVPKREAPDTSTKLRPPGLLELEELLSDYLQTRVKVSMADRRGKVVVEFATLEDLERIYRIMSGTAAS